jgi:hypothetical protein
MERVTSPEVFCKSKSLKKGGGAEGAGVVMIFEESSKMLIARDKDRLSLGLIFWLSLSFKTTPRRLRRRPLN